MWLMIATGQKYQTVGEILLEAHWKQNSQKHTFKEGQTEVTSVQLNYLRCFDEQD